MFVSKRDNKNH